MVTGLPDDDIDHNTHSSVVLHVDLDCFYAAVEHVRLGIPRDVPLAVQQWDGLIAINYAARAAGITRHERVHEAIKKCPELQCVHVETIGDESGNLDAPNKGQAKVSLERYRQASASVFKIFHRFSDICEKASIDEAYLDVTSRVEKMINQECSWDQELRRLVGNQEKGPEMIVLDGPLVPFNSYDRRMLAGAIIAEKIRSAVRNELGYTCSVGIATNKLLAKIASAKNKPDKQTVIPPRAVPGLMQSMPLKKVKLLGGKLGEEMSKKWGVTTAGEAQAISLAALVGCFGERSGNYVWHAVRGIQADKVQVKQVAKSMLAAKSFNSTKELSDIRRWLSILAEELSVRMVRDFEQNHRHPRLLQLYYRSGDFRNSREHTKSWTMPLAALSILSQGPSSEEESTTHENRHQNTGEEDIHEDQSKDLVGLVVSERSRSLARVLEDASYNVFRRLEGTFPCSRLALAAGGFQDLPATGTKSIQHFFTSVVKGNCNSSPVQNAQRPEPRNHSSQIKGKAKVKGMLKFLKHEAPSGVQEKRRRDAEEHLDGSLKEDHAAGDLATPGQSGNGGHNPQNASRESELRASEPKPRGMYKFFSHGDQLIGRVQGSEDAFGTSDILDTTVNSHDTTANSPSLDSTDKCGSIEESGGVKGDRHTSAFSAELDNDQAKSLAGWNSDLEIEELLESDVLSEDDDICCHQPELPSSPVDENIGSVQTCSGYRSGALRSKVEVVQVDTKDQMVALIQHPNQQATKPEWQGVSTPDKKSFEHTLKRDLRPQSLTSPAGKRNRQPASNTGQQSIVKFFRTQGKT